MFKDYEIIKYLAYNQATDQCSYLVKIIDDDFVEETVVADADPKALLVVDAVIKVYSQKQFNVAHNLTLLILRINKKFPWYKTDDIIEDFEKYVTEFLPFSKNVKNLLLFA